MAWIFLRDLLVERRNPDQIENIRNNLEQYDTAKGSDHIADTPRKAGSADNGCRDRVKLIPVAGCRLSSRKVGCCQRGLYR